jgi:hypothetical protein
MTVCTRSRDDRYRTAQDAKQGGTHLAAVEGDESCVRIRPLTKPLNPKAGGSDGTNQSELYAVSIDHHTGDGNSHNSCSQLWNGPSQLSATATWLGGSDRPTGGRSARCRCRASSSSGAASSRR